MTTTPPSPRRAPRRGERDAILADPGFGKHFTDHMVDDRPGPASDGWHAPAVKPYGPLALDPADGGAALRPGDLRGAEGLPARRRLDLDVPARRRTPQRMHRSARRLALPELPEEDFLESIEAARRGRRRLGAAGGGDQPVPAAVHVSPPRRSSACGRRNEVGLHVIAVAGRRRTSPAESSRSPSGCPREYARAGHGGTGAAKCGGNYAASLLAQLEAYAHGCDQVLFLDPVDATRTSKSSAA